MRVTLRAVEDATGKAMIKVNQLIDNASKKLTGTLSQKGVADRVKKPFDDVAKILRNQIAAAYKESYYRECYEVQNQLGYYFKPRKLSTGEIVAFVNGTLAGKNWLPRLQRWYMGYINEVSTITTAGEELGISQKEIDDLIRSVTGRNGDSGLSYKIMRIMRTESANAANRGMVSAYKQLGIKRYKIVSILDDRLCKFCHEERNGRIYYVRLVKKGVNLPPFHPNCRCYIIPMISRDVQRSVKKKGEKGRLTYSQWRAKYGI